MEIPRLRALVTSCSPTHGDPAPPLQFLLLPCRRSRIPGGARGKPRGKLCAGRFPVDGNASKSSHARRFYGDSVIAAPSVHYPRRPFQHRRPSYRSFLRLQPLGNFCVVVHVSSCKEQEGCASGHESSLQPSGSSLQHEVPFMLPVFYTGEDVPVGLNLERRACTSCRTPPTRVNKPWDRATNWGTEEDICIGLGDKEEVSDGNIAQMRKCVLFVFMLYLAFCHLSVWRIETYLRRCLQGLRTRRRTLLLNMGVDTVLSTCIEPFLIFMCSAH
nr:uncharacterized protein LOC127341090 isoform X2 [Lolium perenne]